MSGATIFRPGKWTDSFLLVGTGAVTLADLVFVAISLNLKVIAIDATQRNQAINNKGLLLISGNKIRESTSTAPSALELTSCPGAEPLLAAGVWALDVY